MIRSHALKSDPGVTIMRAAVLLLALLPISALAAKPDACQRGAVQKARDTKPQPGVHRLDQLPPANEQLALYRLVDGCETPVIVRYDVDGRTRQR